MDRVNGKDVLDYGKTSSERWQETGNGVLTELYVDSTEEDVVVTIIDTFVAEVTKVEDNGDDYTVTISYKSDKPSKAENEFDTDQKFSKEDIVVLTIGGTEIQSMAKAEIVEGTVSSVKDNDYVKLDGTTSTEIVDIDNDPGAGYVDKNTLREGAAYEYSVKGGEYRFKELDQTKDYFGDYTAKMAGASAPASATSGLAITKSATLTDFATAGSDKYIGGVKVDDSAKIVLIEAYDGAADYKVISGKQFKSLDTVALASGSTGKAIQQGGIAAFTSKVNGVNRVTYAVVAVDKIADSFVTNDHYGYVVEASYKSDDGYTVYTIWNGSENVKVQEKGTDSRAKGAVIGYSSITKEDGLADGIVGTIEDVDTNFGLQDKGVVHGVNKDQTSISLDGKNTNDITKDTIVLYVDTKDHKGYANGEIQEADDFGSGKIPNVMYKLDGVAPDADVELLIVDVKNNLRGEFSYVFGSGADINDINNALTKGDVEINGTLPAGTLTVGDGNTLTLAKGAAVNGDVKIEGTGAVKVEDVVQIGAAGKLTLPATTTLATGAGFEVAAGGNLVGWESNKLGALNDSGAAYSVTCSDGANVSDNLDIVIKGDATLKTDSAKSTLGSSDEGSMVIEQGVTVTVSSGTWLKLGGAVTVKGTVTVQSGGNIVLRDDGKIEFTKDADLSNSGNKVAVNGTKVKISAENANNINTIIGTGMTADGSYYTTSDSGANWAKVQ